MPILLLAIAFAALFGSNYLDDQLHENLGEVASDDTVPPGVGTPLVSTRRLTAMLAPPLTEAGFFDALDRMMATAPASACLNVTLDNRDFYKSNANIQVMPLRRFCCLPWPQPTRNSVLITPSPPRCNRSSRWKTEW